MNTRADAWDQYYEAVRQGRRRDAEAALKRIHGMGRGQNFGRPTPTQGSSRRVRNGGCSRCRKRF